jgi:outer membrane protein TolC
LEQTDEEIALQVREARCNLQTARNRVRVAARAEESASRNLDAATHLWRSGLTRHVEVLDAHAKLTDTEYEVTAARADLEVARAALEHAVGRLDAEFAGAGTSEPAQP